jgi:hypothetical protein
MAQDLDQDTSTDWGLTEVYLAIALGCSKNRTHLLASFVTAAPMSAKSARRSTYGPMPPLRVERAWLRG